MIFKYKSIFPNMRIIDTDKLEYYEPSIYKLGIKVKYADKINNEPDSIEYLFTKSSEFKEYMIKNHPELLI